MANFFDHLTYALLQVLESPLGPALSVLMIAALLLIIHHPPGGR